MLEKNLLLNPWTPSSCFGFVMKYSVDFLKSRQTETYFPCHHLTLWMKALSQNRIEKSVRIFRKSGNCSLCIFIDPSWWNFDIRKDRISFWQDLHKIEKVQLNAKIRAVLLKKLVCCVLLFLNCCGTTFVSYSLWSFEITWSWKMFLPVIAIWENVQARYTHFYTRFSLLWVAEKSCSFVWIWKGSIHNYSFLVSDPCVISMSSQLVIIQCLLLRVVFTTRATIEHHPVFHPKQKILMKKKNDAKPLKTQNLYSTKNAFRKFKIKLEKQR